jgi:hypothetical protein
MRLLLKLCAAVTGVVAGLAPSFPARAASVMLTVDGGAAMSLPTYQDGKFTLVDGSSCEQSAPSGACLVESAGAWRVELFAQLNPDPDIGYAIAVTDFGAPSTFGFSFLQGIVPTAAPGLVQASLSGSTTNGGGVAGPVTITPVAPPLGIPTDGDLIPEIQVYTLSTDGGATFLSAGLDLGPAFTSNPALISDVYGPFNTALVGGPAAAGAYDTMRVDVNFGLSGGGDIFTFNGSAFVIPEPATAGLLALGLVGLAVAGRSRRGASE